LMKYLKRIIEDVPLYVGKFFIPCDFVVMKLEEGAEIPIILGCPFIFMEGEIIDIKN